MPNQIQQIIKQAKELGYIPEKKEGTAYEKRLERQVMWTDIGFNQAIDSFNLEKIIELAYERWRESYIEMIENQGEQNHITQAILSAMEYRGFDDCGKYLDADIWEKIKPILLTNLSNKED